MGLIKLMFLPMRMLTWPVMAPLRMMMWPFKMAFRFVTVMLLLAQLMVTLFLAAMFVIFTVVPTIMVGLYGLYWVMKKCAREGWRSSEKCICACPRHVGLNHNWTKNSVCSTQ